MTVEIDVEDYISMLEERRRFVVRNYGWTDVPDKLWDYVMELYRAGCGEGRSASFVVDNMLVNGDWGSFDDYKKDGEEDENFVRRVRDEVFWIDEDERQVCFSL